MPWWGERIITVLLVALMDKSVTDAKAIAPAFSMTAMAAQAPLGSQSTHLAVLVHGYVGTPGDLNYLRSAIEREGAGRYMVHQAQANLLKTHDGVKSGGYRLAREVREVVAANPSLQSISFVGNSLGGVYSRYALSILFDSEQKTIAGLEPRTFMTVASPHLGVRKFTVVPLPDRVHVGAVPVFMGQTGADLFLGRQGPDPEGVKTKEGEIEAGPLLLNMATLPKYLDPLRAFRYRRAYANVREDLLVPFGTAAFEEDMSSLPPPVSTRVFNPQKIKLSVYRLPAQAEPQADGAQAPGVLGTGLSAEALGGVTATLDSRAGGAGVEGVAHWMEVLMAKRLNTLGWTKVAVEFTRPLLRSHNLICALSRDRWTSWLFQRGRPVMDHAARFLVDPEHSE